MRAMASIHSIAIRAIALAKVFGRWTLDGWLVTVYWFLRSVALRAIGLTGASAHRLSVALRAIGLTGASALRLSFVWLPCGQLG